MGSRPLRSPASRTCGVGSPPLGAPPRRLGAGGRALALAADQHASGLSDGPYAAFEKCLKRGGWAFDLLIGRPVLKRNLWPESGEMVGALKRSAEMRHAKNGRMGRSTPPPSA